MTSLETLRETAADFWWWLRSWMGDPVELARQGFVRPHSYRLLRDWVVTLEILVRRIVYLAALEIDTATLTFASGRKGSGRTTPVIPARRPCLRLIQKRYHYTAPEFHYRRRRRPDDEDEHLRPMRIGRLARRFEALRHAIWHTRPHAERLARLLKRREAKGGALPQLKPWPFRSKRTVAGVELGQHIWAIEGPINEHLHTRNALIPTGKHEEPG